MFNNLPNCLTLSRIIIIPLLAILVMINQPITDFIACLLFILAGVTDYLDGKLARAWQQLSELGRMLDPIADKLLVGILLIVMASYDRLPYGGLIPAMVILSREILVSGLREFLASSQVSLPVTKLSKWKTTFQMIAIGFLLAGDSSAEMLGIGWAPISLIGAVLLWISGILTIVTGWGYVYKGINFINKSEKT
ncbi:CDP-diacylglycerol--glycerol-3-phosphate 3-phosphatidyltransferase [Commensalibacter oyaizuii]|uniref:CDP-diacylglycerol--glycerol-3-phosphate 3-phosphatidyltransferase n=1 Tax=Commensalibacter oyaizuii TaxID=3043873 RepID=A0ABT6PZE0_9PROT|nr:CDP-diacylglycerol--glycerol-3-phosphate 3-phosphatidyltransferase [Commensalibacter sp. TBRC 16381]MDI2090227.1 CDP-diacylglycerol--glycerol-3-phosphate 3-phosphatidyltransferase [Commensalibacter sp. TBRC 16381]